MNILFIFKCIIERGSAIRSIRLARGNMTILKNHSFIACRSDHVINFDLFLMMKAEFKEKLFIYYEQQQLDDFIQKNKIDLVYFSHDGKQAELPTKFEPLIYHSMFTTLYPQGTLFTCISEWLNRRFQTHFPVLPHIVENFEGIPVDKYSLRKSLGIPENATVFGGYGGREQFDIPFAKSCVVDIAKKHNIKRYISAS